MQSRVANSHSVQPLSSAVQYFFQDTPATLPAKTLPLFARRLSMPAPPQLPPGSLPPPPALRPCSTPDSSAVFPRPAAISDNSQTRGQSLSTPLPAARSPSAKSP